MNAITPFVTFPTNPTVGQTVTGPIGAVWVWDGYKWTFATGLGGQVVSSFNTRVGAITFVPNDNTSGNLVFINQQQLSNVAWMTFQGAFTSAYDDYVINVNSQPVSANPTLVMQFMIGATAQATAYAWCLGTAYGDGTIQYVTNAAFANTASGDAWFQLTGGCSNNQYQISNSRVRIFKPLDPSIRKNVFLESIRANQSGLPCGDFGAAQWYGTGWTAGNPTAAVDGFRIGYYTGNVANGTVTLYGVQR